jgi:NADH-quinone oxidoreductase subunit J
MSFLFVILGLITLGAAIAAVTLRNLVHCALCLVLVFAGIAALYLQLHAQFVGFAQVLVYIGAVAILIVFAILLTRSGDVSGGVASGSWGWGAGIALLAGGSLLGAVLGSSRVEAPTPPPPSATVKAIGAKLMSDYVVPLEVVGLLLTAALIGAVVIAMHEKRGGSQP